MVEVAEKLAATDKRQKLWEISFESESWSDHEKNSIRET